MLSKRERFIEIVVVAATVLSVLSQLPFFVSNGMTSVLSIPGWIIVLGYCFYLNRFKMHLKKAKKIYTIYFVFMGYFLIMSAFNSRYASSQLPYNISVAMFMLFVGIQVGPHIRRETVRYMALGYVIATAVLCAYVYLQFFRGVSINSTVYEYDEKNSTSLIILTAVIFLMLFFIGKNPKHKVIKYGSLVFFCVLILIMRSRATYISCAIFFVILLLNGYISKKMRKYLMYIAVAAVVYLLINQELLNKLLDMYVFAGRSSSDIDALSSGRLVEWQHFFDDMDGKWLLGQGRQKRESLILTALLEFGIPIGSAVIAAACIPLYKSIKLLKNESIDALIFFSIAITYTVNLIFEQLAPFGPGVKCFMLWILLGFYLSNPDLIEDDLFERYILNASED